PDIFPVETLHALTKAERQRRIPRATAGILWQAVMADSPSLSAHIPLLTRAHQIATAAGIGIYDCLYVALAEQERCGLITADARLIGNLQTQFPFVQHLSAIP